MTNAYGGNLWLILLVLVATTNTVFWYWSLMQMKCYQAVAPQ